MLIAFAGLPGTGKTTIARELARRLHATYLRVDTVEQALRSCGTLEEVMAEGYEAIYRLTEDNLHLGLTVIADSVNPIAITRDAWAEVAREANVQLVNVEVICSDEAEHRRRVETRTSDILDLVLPTWDKIKNREHHPWTQPRIVIDTAGRSIGACVDELMPELAAARSTWT
jgi:predicted kinase